MREVTRKGLMTVAAATGVMAAAGGAQAHADSGANGATSNSPGVLSGNTVSAPVSVPVNACGNTVSVVGLLNPAMGNKCANGGGGGKGGGGNGTPGGHGNHGNQGSHGGQGGHGSSGGYGEDGGYGGHGSPGGYGGYDGYGGHGGPGGYGDSGTPGGFGYPGSPGGSADWADWSGWEGSYAGGYATDSPGVGSGNHVEAPVDAPVNLCGNTIDVVGLLNPSLGNDCSNTGDDSGGGHPAPLLRPATRAHPRLR